MILPNHEHNLYLVFPVLFFYIASHKVLLCFILDTEHPKPTKTVSCPVTTMVIGYVPAMARVFPASHRLFPAACLLFPIVCLLFPVACLLFPVPEKKTSMGTLQAYHRKDQARRRKIKIGNCFDIKAGCEMKPIGKLCYAHPTAWAKQNKTLP